MNKKLFIFLSVFLPSLAFSQIVSDAKIWTGFSISKKIDDFKFSISEEYRRAENFSQTDKMFTEFDVSHKLIKNLSASATYRFNQDRNFEQGGFDFNQRLSLDLSYDYELNDFEFSARTRYQVSFETYSNDKLNRNKFSVKYNFNKKLDPYLSYELFYQFNDVRAFNRTRFELGSKYKLNKNNSFKLGYIFENKFNRTNLEHNHIYFINYSIEI